MLTSWKEIANHFGKSVRTVQRWEREMGLPIRRPRGLGFGTVLADPNELSGWFSAQPQRRFEMLDEIESLRVRCQDLSRTVEFLTARCSKLEAEHGTSAAASVRAVAS